MTVVSFPAESSGHHGSDVNDALILDLLPAAAYVCDADGLIVRYNRKAAEFWGRSPAIGDSNERYCGAHRLYWPDGTFLRQERNPMVAALRDGTSTRNAEVVVERPDGSRIAVVLNIDPIRDARGKIIGAVNCFQDVTERKASTAGVEEVDAQLREVLDAMPMAVYTTDAQGKITFYNRAAVDFAGREPVLGDDSWCVTWRLYHLDGTPLPHDECPMAVALKEGRIVRGVEAIAERPDGSRIYFMPFPTPLHDASGKVIGAVNVLMDTSDRREQFDIAQRLAAIVESSDDAIVSKTLDGTITSWNAGAQRIFGYTPDEAIGRPVTILIPLDRWNEEADIVERLKRGERIDHYETVRRRKDGQLIAVSLTVSPVKDSAGTIVGASKIARDVTTQKRAEERAQLLARELDHRANNLLATVQAILRLTRASALGDYRQAVEGRIGALAQAHKLASEADPRGINMRRLIDQELVPYGIGDGLRCTVSGPEILVGPRATQALALVFHELATNSAKYGALSHPAGSIAISWTVSEHGDVRFRWVEAGGPAILPPAKRGFGTALIEAVVRDDLAGELSFHWQPTGLACEFTLIEDRLASRSVARAG